jgi:hypothetical protein
LAVDAQAKDLLAGGYIQVDETHVSVQTRRTLGRNHQAYFWRHSGPKGPVVFEFQMGRERAGPENCMWPQSWMPAAEGSSVGLAPPLLS